LIKSLSFLQTYFNVLWFEIMYDIDDISFIMKKEVHIETVGEAFKRDQTG